MKRLITLLVILSTCYFSIAQQCTDFFPLVNNANWEVNNFDDKGKLTAIFSYDVKSVTDNNGEIVAIVNSTISDKKGKNVGTYDMEMKCKNETVYIDMSSFVMNNQNMQMSDFDIKMGGDFMEIPKNLKVGMDLKDATYSAEMAAGGVGLMKLTVNIYDRKVISNEKITVPAGTFDCSVITEKSKMKMLVNMETSSKTWYAPGVGMVKQESYNKKGKLVGYSELNKLNK